MPPIGYVWVRVGHDALLVDEFNGRVVQVVRYVFW
jgi:Ni/Co efflux regulator RcnB